MSQSIQARSSAAPFNARITFGIQFKITDREYIPETPDDEEDSNNEKEMTYAEYKQSKTRNAPNGRQKSRQAKAIELASDIRKKTNYWTKVMITNAYLSLDEKLVLPELKRTKHTAQQKTQLRQNKQAYKTEQQHQSSELAC
jgi:hypothetical protein